MEQLEIGSVAEAVVQALDGRGTRALYPHLDGGTLLHMPGGSGLAGDYQGAEAIVGLLERMTAASDDTLRFTLWCTTTQPHGTVRLCGTVHGQRSGRHLSSNAVVEATVFDGAIREAWLSCTDEPAWDAFWR